MQTKHFSNNAMTLTELIVASVLVGIVTLGLIAAEQAIRMSRQSSHRDAQISAQLQAAMIKLNQDASSTVGDVTDTGIYQYSLGDDLGICFRQAAGDANTYMDDIFNCWSVNKSSGLLTSCSDAMLPAPFTSCIGKPDQFDWVTLIPFDITYPTFYSVVNTSDTTIAPTNFIIKNQKISYIQLDLRSRYNRSVADHPIENPTYILNARISPTGLSR